MPKSVHTDRYRFFCELLIQARNHAGLTQIDLGKRLSKPQSYVSKYERGDRRLDVVEFLDIAEALGIDVTDIVRKLRSFPEDDPA